MLTYKEKVEYELLRLLTDTREPIGSATLSLLLKEREVNISGATVGRMLSELDRVGLTERHGYKGRVLTESGALKLEQLGNKRLLDEFGNRFYESVDAESKDNLIDILMARRGIERESARLAAIRASDEDILNLKRAHRLQAEDASRGVVSPDNDVLFHQAIAKASKNRVLVTAYDFIWQHGKLSPVMEYIRSSVGGSIAVDHAKILEALLSRNPDEAEKRMVEHIDSLINDVKNYWNKVEQEHSIWKEA